MLRNPDNDSYPGVREYPKASLRIVAEFDPVFCMREALAEAGKGALAGEVPVGAVVVVGGEIVARAHNEVESLQDATAHAEVLALRRAAERLGSWRLDNASLIVTLEPCTMCVGAMLLSRVKKLYFGCYDPVQGAAGSAFDITSHPALPHAVEVIPELLAKDSETLLKDFFLKARRGDREAEGA